MQNHIANQLKAMQAPATKPVPKAKPAQAAKVLAVLDSAKTKQAAHKATVLAAIEAGTKQSIALRMQTISARDAEVKRARRKK
jgi:hypothetical protein